MLSYFFLLISIMLLSTDSLCQEDYDTNLSEMNKILSSRDFSKNNTKFGCVWKSVNSECPDRDINFYYYSGLSSHRKKKVVLEKKNSVTETNWNPQKENIIFIHGYGGGEGTFPNNIIRDAYIRDGSYNVFVVDWSPLSRIPCYTAAIYNLKAVAKCTSLLYRNLRFQGISPNQITCVGHSLGAHICGLISNYVNFRLQRIIGLDPAGPMISSSSRLSSGMANHVQVIHTNAGTFGDSTSSGKVNFCMNGGKWQSICDNSPLGPDLCSHIVAVCYMAESINGSNARTAQRCTRQCPHGPRLSTKADFPVVVGQHTPNRAVGSYCVYTNEPPYCPNRKNNYNGHSWCCLGKTTDKESKKLGKLWNKHKSI